MRTVMCPTCRGKGSVLATQSMASWQLTLMYLARQELPIWGGPLKRGAAIDEELRALVDRGLVRQVDDEGFILTPTGRRMAETIRVGKLFESEGGSSLEPRTLNR